MSGIPQPRGRIPVRGSQGRTSGLPQPTKTLYATPVPSSEEAGYGGARAGASGLKPPSSNYGRPSLRSTTGMQQSRLSKAAPSSEPTETKTTKTVIEPSGRKTTTSTTTKIRYASDSPFRPNKRMSDKPIPTGQFYVPPKYKPWSKEGKVHQFSSPEKLRGRMDKDKDPPKYMILPHPKDVRDYQILQKHPLHRDLLSGNVRIGARTGSPPSSPLRRFDSSGLDENISPDMIGEDWDEGEESIPSPPQSPLQRDTHQRLLESSMQSPNKALKATGARQTMTSPKVLMGEHGPVEVTLEMKSSQKIIRSPNQPEIIEKRVRGTQLVSPGRAIATELDLQKMDPKSVRKSPEKGQEVVQIISNVLIAPGVQQITKTVEFEEPGGRQRGSPKPDPRQVSLMVDEETADVNRTKGLIMPDLKSTSPSKYGIRKRVEIEQLAQEDVSLLESSLYHQHQIVTGDEQIEETDPEVIANILNTEERGLTMDSAPANLYNYLFPEGKSEPITDVCSAAPAPLQDIVVPAVNLPDQVKENINNANVLQISMQIEKEAKPEVSTNAFVEQVGAEPIKPNNIAKRGKKKKKTNVTLLNSEIPPWGIQDLDPVVDVVGGPPAGIMVSENAPDVAEQVDPTVDGIEYMLRMEPPQHFSRVQLRGSQKPPWFPGYYVSLPHYPEIIKLAKSPSVVFSAAWKATQPDIFEDDSLFVV